jgi:hypothetical protein
VRYDCSRKASESATPAASPGPLLVWSGSAIVDAAASLLLSGATALPSYTAILNSKTTRSMSVLEPTICEWEGSRVVNGEVAFGAGRRQKSPCAWIVIHWIIAVPSTAVGARGLATE